MSVDVRVGDYHLDSSNFLSEDGFQGFLGSTGEVGIDRDYNSLRQDLWLATDQAYKAAVTQMSLKQAFLRSLTKPPEIDDFSQSSPIIKIEPHAEPDWTSRNWDDEARAASVALKDFPQLYGTRVNYYIVYATTYLMTSEGTTMRTSTQPRLDRGRARHGSRRRFVRCTIFIPSTPRSPANCPMPRRFRKRSRRPRPICWSSARARSLRTTPDPCFSTRPRLPP